MNSKKINNSSSNKNNTHNVNPTSLHTPKHRKKINNKEFSKMNNTKDNNN